MWPVINSSAPIGWNILSSLNAVISTNERSWIQIWIQNYLGFIVSDLV